MNKDTILDKARSDNKKQDEGKRIIELSGSYLGYGFAAIFSLIIWIIREIHGYYWLSPDALILSNSLILGMYISKYKYSKKKRYIFLIILSALVIMISFSKLFKMLESGSVI